MTTVTIRGIPVSFPFTPYDIQKKYMEKVIECLQEQVHGVLESPTGTGKTLSLLCSSLAWLTLQKAKNQAEKLKFNFNEDNNDQTQDSKLFWNIPTILYASRTHSQLSQAMQELKRTSYAHVRSTIIGSRDQMCIHPDVMQQTNNSTKIQMCRAMVKTRSCHLYNRVEKMAVDSSIRNMNITDIEDLVKVGQKHKFCPYYMSKELKNQADIIFLPYNYLLDPKARRAHQLNLNNSIIILDEAHNVEKICEDSASFQIKTTDIALCIDEITQVMKYIEKNGNFVIEDKDMDFSAEDLTIFKEMLLNLEKTIDEIPLPKNSDEGCSFEGKYIFEILKQAGINDDSKNHVLNLIDNLIQFLTTAAKENPFQRTGSGIQTLQDLLVIVYQKDTEIFKERINKCYKVHVALEEKKSNSANTWLSKASSSKSDCRVLSYWCLSPNFGMQMLLEQGVRSVILTSGTLAPLKPLISELGIDIAVQLENPHVIDDKQICVKILGKGPDGTPLNSNFNNRNNEKYLSSLGFAIVNIARHIPNGLLIFFPSYFLLAKCKESWENSGIWNNLNQLKMVFVEPKAKIAFNEAMTQFYETIKNPSHGGAVFMAVCRGKVSEGLDFANENGRAVIITGLPYPPYKDRRVALKRQYLDICRSKNSEYLSGQEWYTLEATRAVNQAIGRVIRHRHDYGSILFLDNRFESVQIKSQLSLWVREQVSLAKNFGEVIRHVRLFFHNATEYDKFRDNLKTPSSSNSNSTVMGEVKIYDNKSVPSSSNSVEEFTISENKRRTDQIHNQLKRRKIILVKPFEETSNESIKIEGPSKNESVGFIHMLKKNLDDTSYDLFKQAISAYKASFDFDELLNNLNKIFLSKPNLTHLLQGMLPYLKEDHREQFLAYWQRMRN